MKTLNLALALAIVLSVGGMANAGQGEITESLLKQFEQGVKEQPETRLRVNALTNVDIKALSLDREHLLSHNDRFNFNLKSAGITDQRGSGRRWLFAGLNLLAPKIMTELKLDEFELSQPYLTFYDKLEKANCFLEDVIRFRDSSLNTWTMQVLLEDPFGDGGWWHYVTDLIDKYGVVPLSAMPETKQSVSTDRINTLAATLLRRDAAELRQMNADHKNENSLRQRKEAMLGDVYQMLVYAYGEPPQEFEFRYEVKPEDSTKADSSSQDSSKTSDTEKKADDKDKPKSHDVIEKHTPRSFYEKYLKPRMKEYVALCNNPMFDMDRLYRNEGGRNVQGRPDLTLLNLPVEKLKQYALKSLLDSQVVWFACDVSKENLGDSGIFMRGIYDYGTTFGMNFDMNKRELIGYRDITPNHAMVFMGVDTANDGTPTKWLVQKSWGDKAGKSGKWTMYDSWFDEYVMVTIVDKSLLSADDAAKLEQTPVIVPYCEPFFLALRRL